VFGSVEANVENGPVVRLWQVSRHIYILLPFCPTCITKRRNVSVIAQIRQLFVELSSFEMILVWICTAGQTSR
jgi:hypothetical protein